MVHSVNEVLDAAKNENLIITIEQAEEMLRGRKIYGVSYFMKWDDIEGRIYILPKDPKPAFVPKTAKQLAEKMQEDEKKSKNNEETLRLTQATLNLYSDEFIDELHEFAVTLSHIDLPEGILKKACEKEISDRKKAPQRIPVIITDLIREVLGVEIDDSQMEELMNIIANLPEDSSKAQIVDVIRSYGIKTLGINPSMARSKHKPGGK